MSLIDNIKNFFSKGGGSSSSNNKKQRAKKRKVQIDTKYDDYVQNFIPIKDVRNGVIETTDNRYIKILEVEPTNFMLRSFDEQKTIISTFASWFKMANTKIQFKSITKRADSERHIKLLLEDMEGEENEKTIEMSKAYIDLIRNVGTTEALTRRFFIIFEYEPLTGMAYSDNYIEILQTLNSAAATASSFLSRCGNEVIEHENPDLAVGEFLYMFFNRRSSIEEPFEDRVKRVTEDAMKKAGRVPGIDPPVKVPFVNYVAPRGLDLSNVNHIVMDGLYYTFLYIKSDGYPNKVFPGWTSTFVNAGEGIDVDMYFEKVDRGKAIDDVSRRTRLNKVKMKSTYDTSSDFEELGDAIVSGYYIKEALSRNNEDLFYLTTIITITAPTLKSLEWKKNQLTSILRTRDILVSDAPFRQENCFKTVMPFCSIDKDIQRKSKRNILTTSAASTYMFTSFEISDDNGILLGINKQNNSLCIIDIFNSKVYKNANMTIIGTSGSGKTFTEQLMALRMRMRGIQCFILAPLKGHEFRRACDNIGGSYIKISPGSNHCINVMEIREVDEADDSILEEYDISDHDSVLAKKIQQLNIFFELLVEDMTNVEQQLMDEAIVETYRRKGITHDNDSLYNEYGELKEMPILEDLYEVLKENKRTERLAILVNRFVSGSAKSFNNHTNVNLDNKYIVMDISDLKGSLLPVGMFIALDYCWDQIKQDRTKKKAIFVDETWMLIGGSSNKYAAEFVLEVFKIIRGYGGAAIAATQDLFDFFALEGGKYGKGIINNSKTKIILNLEDDEARAVQESFNLTESEIDAIKQFNRGEALLYTNSNKIIINIIPSDVEHELITTDRAELEAIAKRKKLS